MRRREIVDPIVDDMWLSFIRVRLLQL